MKKAVDTITTSFKSQLAEHDKKISELETELASRKEMKLKLQGALEGFSLLDEEFKKPENQPIIQLDDEDEEE